MGWFAVVATAIWAMLPAYIPNNVAVLLGGGPPIDAGRTWRGTRLLGDGKTWRGTTAGALAGVILAFTLNAARPDGSRLLGIVLPSFSPTAIVTLPLGAMLGDIVASFLKRRIGHERGAPVPGLDQLDFVVGALIVTALAAPGWFGRTFTPVVIATVIVITPILHLSTNAVGYVLGLKNEPW